MSTNYPRQSTWVDGSGGGTPVSAARLNAIEAASESLDVALSAAIATKAAAGAAPTAHATSHTAAGGDALTLAESQVTNLVADLAAKAPLTKTINNQVGTTYTLALADAGALVRASNAAAIVVTVPTNATAAFPIGTEITLAQPGAGQVTITPTAGVTLNYYSPTSSVTAKLVAQHTAATLVKVATDTWAVYGNLA
jgi:hypothetical protein